MRPVSSLLRAALALCALLADAAQAQQIARLYAARAPAGSAYVRVVSAGEQPVRVEFGGKREALDGRRRPVSDYRIIDAAAPMPVKLDGAALAPLALAPGSFNTIVLAGGTAVLLADATDARDDLKAELRFYNLSPGCDASLALKDGPAVFSGLAFRGAAKRNINPVAAALRGACAAAANPAATPAAPLPPLKPGDHVSLFLLGPASAPRLHIQADATETPPAR